MDWASPEKVECLCFSDSQEDKEIGAGKNIIRTWSLMSAVKVVIIRV